MADVKETALEVMTEYPARLQMSMLAPVKKIAALIPEGDKEARIIGYVFGVARGVSFRNNPNSTDGEAAAGLIGAFEGIPQYDDMPGMEEGEKCAHRARLASGVTFLPPQAQAAYVTALLPPDTSRPDNSSIKRGQRSDVLGMEVPISLEVAIRKSSSPVGYEWVVRGLAKVEAKSPIDRMRELMGTGPGSNLAKIVDQTEKAGARTAPKAIAAPAGKGKAARKK